MQQAMSSPVSYAPNEFKTMTMVTMNSDCTATLCNIITLSGKYSLLLTNHIRGGGGGGI